MGGRFNAIRSGAFLGLRFYLIDVPGCFPLHATRLSGGVQSRGDSAGVLTALPAPRSVGIMHANCQDVGVMTRLRGPCSESADGSGCNVSLSDERGRHGSSAGGRPLAPASRGREAFSRALVSWSGASLSASD